MKRYLNKLIAGIIPAGQGYAGTNHRHAGSWNHRLIFGADFLNIPVIAGLSSIVFGNVDFLFVLGAAGAYSKAKDKTTVMVGASLAF